MKTKRYTAILTALVMIMTALPTLGFSGKGTESDPYLISTPADLEKMHDDLGGFYKLTTDIDMSGWAFTPIGNENEGTFTGTLDGADHAIKNLNINFPDEKYVGLFGCLEGTVKNLNLTNVNAYGYRYVGTIAGYVSKNAQIFNCSSSGTVGGKLKIINVSVGGIAAYNAGLVEQCVNNTDVAANDAYIGGIIGYSCGKIKDCENNGHITSNQKNVGGIAGYNTGNVATCKNKGEVYGHSCGGVSGSNYGSVNSCENHGAITGNYIGGIVGSSSGEIIECANYGFVSGNNYTGGIVERNYGNIVNCKNYGTITSADSDTGGIIGRNNGTVRLCSNYGPISGGYTGGIAGFKEGGLIADSINYGDINGKDYTGGITGYDDGDNFTNRCINYGNVVANYLAAGISGYIDDTEVNNCLNYGKISSNFAGGIAGDSSNSWAIIKSCANYGAIIGNQCAGGIMSKNYNSNTIDCLNNGNVTSIAYSGGIVGDGDYFSSKANVNSGNIVGDISKTPLYHYFLFETSNGRDYSVNLTFDQFKEITNFHELNFNVNWFIDPKTESGFPQIQNMPRHMVLNERIGILKLGEKLHLVAYLDETEEEVIWSSDDDQIAKVEKDGSVIAVNQGICTITAINSEGMKANCSIRVIKPINNISLNKASLYLLKDKSEKLVATLDPTGSIEKIVWNSDNENIATVDYLGNVLAKSTVGSTFIRARSVVTGVETACWLSVIEKSSDAQQVTSLEFPDTSIQMNSGEKKEIIPNITPTSYAKLLIWSSSDESVAAINGGVISALKPGNTVITATADGGLMASCMVMVKLPAKTVTLDKKSLYLEKGMTQRLVATALPSNTDDKLTWTSSAPSIASVDQTGLVTAAGVGTALVTVTADSGVSASCTVTVTEPYVSVREVKLDKASLILEPRETGVLSASVLPANASEKGISWTSSDENVATVNNTGTVTAVALGTAVITATSVNGHSACATVKVVSAAGPSVILSDAKAAPGETAFVTASIAHNPGISGYRFKVNYDASVLTPVSVTVDSAPGGSFETNLNESGRTDLNVLWYSDSDVSTDGGLFTVEFKVSDAAALGKVSEVSLDYGPSDICNTKGETFALYTPAAKFTVAEADSGDVYEDGEITVYDVSLLAQHITKLVDLTPRQFKAADVNDDKVVDIKDVVRLAQYVVGWDVELMELTASAYKPVVTVGSAVADSDGIAEIPVYIKDNGGIAGFNYELEYSIDELDILAITPAAGLSGNFSTNLGSQGENGLMVTWYQESNMADDRQLFTVKVHRKTDAPARIAIKPADNNMCDQTPIDVVSTYVDGYILSSALDVRDEKLENGKFTCELYLDSSYEGRNAVAIFALYDGDSLAEVKSQELVLSGGKLGISIDVGDIKHDRYKLMLWDGKSSMRPLK